MDFLTTLASSETLRAHLDDPDWAVVDCRFRLADPEAGAALYRAGHVPGAVYAHLDRDLSSPVVPGRTGRHPLPDAERLAATFGAWGIDAGVQVVAYDDVGGAFAARVWWLLMWLGHPAAAVLDGGWPSWVALEAPVATGWESRRARRFEPRPALVRSVTIDEVAALSEQATGLFDSRGPDRYRGENETIDKVAGHIPGAESAPYADNLGPDGRFLPPAELRAHFLALVGADAATAASEEAVRDAVFYCGSGVTAAHNVVAAAYAGLPRPRLYVGSYSEWIADGSRPVATGNEPG